MFKEILCLRPKHNILDTHKITNLMYHSEWHRDLAALDWIDALLDQQYLQGLKEKDLPAHTRARELVDLWRAQLGATTQED